MAKPDIDNVRLRDQLAAIAAIEDGPSRDGAPVRWWLTPTWRCTNLHVSQYFYRKRFTKLCTFKFCDATVRLTFPGDGSGPLATPLRPTAHTAAEVGDHVTAPVWAE